MNQALVPERPTTRLARMHRERLDAAQAAAEPEYQSWLEELRWARDDRCPDRQFHDEVPADAKGPGFYSRCRRCGHNTILPF